ncbi:MAG: sensor histidine kinase [Thermoguttaceae bacterium]|jgi:signal transduction histidine kinase|nr:sensor histidine kinase [Thermoguttaceae bacterium]
MDDSSRSRDDLLRELAQLQGRIRTLETAAASRVEADAAAAAERHHLRQLIRLHERERQMVAYEIHDGLAQDLAGAQFQFQAFLELRDRDPEQADRAFETGLRLLNEGLEEARRLIANLKPPVLEELGVIAALDDLFWQWRQQYDLEIEFVHRGRLGRIAPPLETAIYRVVQEGLTNARRHSHSRRVRVVLRRRARVVQVSIRDWGKGFDPDRVGPGRFGLRGIRERAELLGGSASIRSRPGRGTRIAVDLPLIENCSDED